jgi:hypothetical protein
MMYPQKKMYSLCYCVCSSALFPVRNSGNSFSPFALRTTLPDCLNYKRSRRVLIFIMDQTATSVIGDVADDMVGMMTWRLTWPITWQLTWPITRGA